jgi:hypothetical protein
MALHAEDTRELVNALGTRLGQVGQVSRPTEYSAKRFNDAWHPWEIQFAEINFLNFLTE